MLILKTNQIQLIFRSCDCGIQPSNIFSIDAVWQIWLLYKNRVPLASLRFVTGNRIGKFDLQRVKIFVLLDFLKLLIFGFAFVILHHFLVQSVGVVIRKRRRFAGNCVHQQHRFKRFLVRIIDHSDFDIREFESIQFFNIENLQHLDNVAIGYKSSFIGFL